ncbi:MAG: discoidin domain-containing protein, partial [Muribaculaceae bacterium]|nr:discoidin domain-containing protein [Muribaculaceae bacterium]
TENVLLSHHKGGKLEYDTIQGWNVFLLPDNLSFYEDMTYEDIDKAKARNGGKYPQGVYKGTFNLDNTADTFLNFETWGKGLVYLNGHALGRIWNIGPQQTLYAPGSMLRNGSNEILIFDLCGPSEVCVEGLPEPVLDKLQIDDNQNEMFSKEEDTVSYTLIAEGDFDDDVSGWRHSEFPVSPAVRFICIEGVEGVDDSEVASIAEIELLDENGNKIEREKWRVLWCDSADMKSGNHGADKIFDLQESTYWQSEPGKMYPHRIYLDLGEEYSLSGIEYLPSGIGVSYTPIKKFKIYGK